MSLTRQCDNHRASLMLPPGNRSKPHDKFFPSNALLLGPIGKSGLDCKLGMGITVLSSKSLRATTKMFRGKYVSAATH